MNNNNLSDHSQVQVHIHVNDAHLHMYIAIYIRNIHVQVFFKNPEICHL